jgi:hypothetical protein
MDQIMKKILVIGELRTGYDTYSQRTDDFVHTLDSKLNFITNYAVENGAEILFIGGLRERNSDIHSLPTMMKHFYKTSVYSAQTLVKKSGFTDILSAANCLKDINNLAIEIHHDAKALPLRLLKGAENTGWLYYTGDIAEIIPMAELIAEAVQDKRILGVITNSTHQTTEIEGVYAVSPVFRKNEDSKAPIMLLLDGATATSLEVAHNANVFEFSNVTYDQNESSVESDFVSRLKAETLLLECSRDEMDSEKNLKHLIEESLNVSTVTETGKEIVRSLFAQTK